MVPDMWAIKLGKMGQINGRMVISMTYLQNEGISVRPQETGRENVEQLGAHFWISYLLETCKPWTWRIWSELRLGLFPCSVGLWSGSDIMTVTGRQQLVFFTLGGWGWMSEAIENVLGELVHPKVTRREGTSSKPTFIYKMRFSLLREPLS